MTPAPPDETKPPSSPSRSSFGKARDRFFGLSEPDPTRNANAGPTLSERTRLATAGLELAGGILVFAALGWGLDTLINTFPAFLVVGVLLGLTGGLYRLIKAVQPPTR